MNKKFFSFDQLHSNPDNSEYSPNAYNSYNSFDTASPQYSSPYHDTDSVSDNSKKIRKKRNTYQKISDETRKKLLDAVQDGETLKAAAKRFGINYSSAKSILHTFRKEGRICKKSAQERTSRRRVSTKSSQELEMSPIYLSKQYQDDFNGVNEASTYQTYHSPEKSCEASEDEGPKAGVSGLAINSFGGFLKVHSQNQANKGDQVISRTSGSTMVLKLESQRLKQMENVARNCNWQLNVNVHNENRVPYKSTVDNAQHRPSSYEHTYMNYTDSQVGKKEQNHVIDRDYGNLGGVPEDVYTGFDSQSYDVSYFLSSSPAYAFGQQKTYGHEQYGNNENFSSADHLRGVIDPQEMHYDGMNYRPKADVKRAGLSGY